VKKIFVCSPFKGNTTINVRKALLACRKIALLGHAPYAPHTYLPQALDDDSPAERILGMMIGMEFLEACDEVWVFNDEKISDGMLLEITTAESLNKRVRYFTWELEEKPHPERQV
jgi:hypothetical protein